MKSGFTEQPLFGKYINLYIIYVALILAYNLGVMHLPSDLSYARSAHGSDVV
jgi:hypothetical protein